MSCRTSVGSHSEPLGRAGNLIWEPTPSQILGWHLFTYYHSFTVTGRSGTQISPAAFLFDTAIKHGCVLFAAFILWGFYRVRFSSVRRLFKGWQPASIRGWIKVKAGGWINQINSAKKTDTWFSVGVIALNFRSRFYTLGKAVAMEGRINLKLHTCRNNSDVNFISLTFRATVLTPRKEEFSQHRWGLESGATSLVVKLSDLTVSTICRGASVFRLLQLIGGGEVISSLQVLHPWQLQGGNSITSLSCSAGFPLAASRVKVLAEPPPDTYAHGCCLTYWAARRQRIYLLMAFVRGFRYHLKGSF